MKKKTASPKTVRRGRGRPRGRTEHGLETRQKLYSIALALIASKGFEETTLRDIARKARVSVGLLYRYFPSKRAIVLALYDELSGQYAAQAARMAPGAWRERFLFALRTSLAVLGPHRAALTALVPVLVGDKEDGLFSPGTAFSRLRVMQVFLDAVHGATDAPRSDDAAALGRLLYVTHLGVLLGWLLDKSPEQTATHGGVELLGRMLPAMALGLRLPGGMTPVRTADALCRQALFGDEGLVDEPKGRP
jgi:AcrR family transcriptional regulator